MADQITLEVRQLADLDLEALRAAWRRRYGLQPPIRSPDLLRRMLAWRMRHNERTLTGMKLTQHAGLVEFRAPRVR